MYLMQAASSTDGALSTWTSHVPDLAGEGYPGGGTPTDIAIVFAPDEAGFEGAHGRIYPPIFAELTTSATGATAIVSIPLADETAIALDVYVTHAQGATATISGAWKRQAMWRRTGGGSPTLVGSVVSGTDLEGATADDVGITADGNNIVVQVTPSTTATRHWLCELRVQESRAT